MNKKVKKDIAVQDDKRERRNPPAPITEPVLSLILCAVAFAICLIMLVLDRFVFPIGDELLAPVIAQLITLVLPAYLVILLTYRERSAFLQMKKIGFCKLRAKYIFFIIFSALFAVCLSLMLTLSFGGSYDASGGFTLLGIFTAGENEFSVSAPYLIVVYAVVPAMTEEFFFRGVIFSQLKEVSFPFAALISSLLFALSGFSLGGLIPMFFFGIMLVFVFYTTSSLWACAIVHFLFNLYKLFLEANVAAYFLSSTNTALLIITLSLALLISALLFFSESARIYRARAEKIAKGSETSASEFVNVRSVGKELRSALAYKPSLVSSLICLALFVAAVIINYIV